MVNGYKKNKGKAREVEIDEVYVSTNLNRHHVFQITFALSVIFLSCLSEVLQIV